MPYYEKHIIEEVNGYGSKILIRKNLGEKNILLEAQCLNSEVFDGTCKCNTHLPFIETEITRNKAQGILAKEGVLRTQIIDEQTSEIVKDESYA